MHHGNKTAEDSYSLPSKEKHFKTPFDAKIRFVFTVTQEATDDEGYQHTFQIESPAGALRDL